MRNILFRGHTGQAWVYGSYVYRKLQDSPVPEFDAVYDYNEIVEENGLMYEIQPSSLGQSIGIKDKNGISIFEGDILNHHRKYNKSHISTVKVIFKNSKFILYYGNLTYDDADIINRTDYSFEIIGNIYENKDFFKS